MATATKDLRIELEELTQNLTPEIAPEIDQQSRETHIVYHAVPEMEYNDTIFETDPATGETKRRFVKKFGVEYVYADMLYKLPAGKMKPIRTQPKIVLDHSTSPARQKAISMPAGAVVSSLYRDYEHTGIVVVGYGDGKNRRFLEDYQKLIDEANEKGRAYMLQHVEFAKSRYRTMKRPFGPKAVRFAALLGIPLDHEMDEVQINSIKHAAESQIMLAENIERLSQMNQQGLANSVRFEQTQLEIVSGLKAIAEYVTKLGAFAKNTEIDEEQAETKKKK